MKEVSTSGWAWMIGGAAAAGVSALALGAAYLWWQNQSGPGVVPEIAVQAETASTAELTPAPAARPVAKTVAQEASETEVAQEMPEVAPGATEGAAEKNLSQSADVAQGGASAAAPEATALSAPVLDVVRVESDGSALVAGSGQSGSVVIVMLDETEVSRAEVGPDGSFVIFMPVPPGETAKVLSLRSEMDGQARQSQESFIIAPVAAPAEPAETGSERVATAEVEDEAATGLAPQEQAQAGLDADAQSVGADAQEAVTNVGAAQDSDPTVEVGGSDVTAGADAGAISAKPEVSTDGALVVAAVPTDQAANQTVAQVEEQGLQPSEGSAEANSVTTITTEKAAGATDLAATSEAVPTAAEPATSLKATLGADTAVAADLQSVDQAGAEKAADVAALAVSAQGTATAADAAALAEAVVAPAKQEEPAAKLGSQFAVLKADETGLSLVQPVAPTLPELVGKVVLDTISYTPSGDVVLKGRARPASLVRVYLDNAPVAEIASAEDGNWGAELEGIDPGIYTLRLDEIEPAVGRVLSRIETPFKREAPDVLAQSTPQSEGNPSKARLLAVTVQQGDTLWAISDTVYGDGLLFVRVFEANRDQIRNPDLIYPGQIFNLPE